MSMNEFCLLLRGLSEHSRFLQAWAEEPKHIYDPAERDAIRAAALR